MTFMKLYLHIRKSQFNACPRRRLSSFEVQVFYKKLGSTPSAKRFLIFLEQSILEFPNFLTGVVLVSYKPVSYKGKRVVPGLSTADFISFHIFKEGHPSATRLIFKGPPLNFLQ